MKKIIIIMAFLIFSLQLVSSAHYITGYVNDALDGTPANGKTVRMWNYITLDEINSTIGPSGPSGANNTYLFDCEMFDTSCKVGDIITLEVLNDSDNYLGISAVNVTVTGAGYDVVDNITLNSLPTASNSFPSEKANISDSVDFNCSASDLDSNLQTIYFYLNSTGWHLNDSASISGGSDYSIFSRDLPDGNYKYSCIAEDEIGTQSINNYNTSFTVDTVAPLVSLVEYNESYVCGTSSAVRVNCTVTDSLTGIYEVLIWDGQVNHSASFLSGDTYYADIVIDELGDTKFECYAEDYAGNIGDMGGIDITAFPANPDFFVSAIFFSDTSAEGVAAIVNATVENVGCADSGGVQIGLFVGDPDLSGISIDNQTSSISGLSSKNVSLTWISEIGITNLFVEADSNDSFLEANESNNKLNKTVFVTAWQELYGTINASKLIGIGDKNMTFWGEDTGIGGNIFIIDKESQIDWINLQAIGRKSNGDISSNDFSEIDTILGMSSLSDSVSEEFSATTLRDILVHSNIISNVSVIDSTVGSNFKTGILWDMSDDGNGEFDSTEKEDIVFVSEINKSTVGGYGTYDYEIKIPAKIREFDNTDTTEFYFYYDLD